jgi:hypothetical protein
MLLIVKYAFRFFFEGLATSDISNTLGQLIPRHTSLEFNHSATERGSYWHQVQHIITSNVMTME